MKSLNQLAHDLSKMRLAFEIKAAEAGTEDGETLWSGRADTCADAIKVIVEVAKQRG